MITFAHIVVKHTCCVALYLRSVHENNSNSPGVNVITQDTSMDSTV